MKHELVRLRFAPAPTGNMHLGNIRTALMNYIFAKKNGGAFVLRIEDTDSERNFDPGAKKIQNDLKWLGLLMDEGPYFNEKYGPYFQSERTAIYQDYLNRLIQNDQVYRCFCSSEVLEQKRLRLQSLGKAPRYDRSCTNLSQETITQRLVEEQPFIWRFLIDIHSNETVHDIVKGKTIFEMKNFSDFPLTRNDGSFTFIFANCIDDITMRISHVFRGEEHITNTVCQLSLFRALNQQAPLYWHMPLLCNIDGKKLSKRDFGFSLNDLQNDGFLPEAITNYLAIIGGGSFPKEILGLTELIDLINFDQIHSSGHIKYDVEKLRWINRKWIQKITLEDFCDRILPFLVNTFGSDNISKQDSNNIKNVIKSIKNDITTLNQAPALLEFFFNYEKTFESIKSKLHKNARLKEFLSDTINHHLESSSDFLNSIKCFCTQKKIPPKELYFFIRFCLTGKDHGQEIKEILDLLDLKEVTIRLKRCYEAI